MECYSALKEEILSFAATLMNLKDIMLSEISQTHKENNYRLSPTFSGSI